jgi:murein L,D-transpeptidase YcbB/YkuD
MCIGDDLGLRSGDGTRRSLVRTRTFEMRATRLELWLATTSIVLGTAGSSPPAYAAPLAEPETSLVGQTATSLATTPQPPQLPQTGQAQPAIGAPAAPPSAEETPGIPPAAAKAQAPAPGIAPAAEEAQAPAPGIARAAEEAQAPAPGTAPAAEEAQAQASGTAPTAEEAQAPAPGAAPAAEEAQAPAPAPAPAAPAALPATQEPATPASPVPVNAEPAAPTIDQQVAEKIHELFGGKIDRFIDRKSKPAVEAFYSARDYAPLWVENGAESARGKAAAAYLSGVDADGLDPGDYPVPSFANANSDELAEAELKFTATVLTFARHAQLGRVHYSRVSADILYDQVAPEPAAVLAKVAEAGNVAEALDSFNPPQPGYKALKAKLAEARGRNGRGPNRISAGPPLNVGVEDPRVPALRDRLGVTADRGDAVYDKALAEAVKKFQRQRGLPPTGIVNNATVEMLNGGPPRRDRDADIIIANMERWRWLPRDLGKAYVMVNIPDYTLKVVDRGNTVWTTRIVAGKPGDKATPMLSETMKYITVNPTWNVPPSIIKNEYLPALAQDPTVLDRMGLKVEYNRDGSVHIYQPPGADNALGRIRFNFPNKFLVYQHDTPDKNLFASDKRAFSHGCMRVQYPDKYAEVLLNISNPRDGYTAEKIRRMYGGSERDIPLATPIPVHLTYQTAFVDDSGRLVIREDVYGRDSRLLAALKNDDRRFADAPIERNERREASNTPRRQVVRAPVQPPPPPQIPFFGWFR